MMEFFEKAGTTGRIKAGVAAVLSATAKRILQLEPDWEHIDLAELNVDDFISRFRNLRGLEYKPESIVEYERRFKRAVAMFLEYCGSPSTWRYREPPVSRTATGARKDAPKASKSTKPQGQDPSDDVEDGTAVWMHPGLQLVDYPFPLREGCIVRLRLPVDLQTSEVDRLAAFMRTVAMDFKVV